MAEQITNRVPELDISTRLAFDRTRAAFERTMMSWIRTATSLITFGFSVYKFFQPTVRRKVARLWFDGAAIALAITVWGIQYWMDVITFPRGEMLFPASAPSQWQQMGVQGVSETNSLLTTLATGLLGALGLLWSTKGPKPRHWWSASLSAVGAGVSLYFGYVSHLHLLWMIKNDTFDPYSRVYLLPSHLQFYALLAPSPRCSRTWAPMISRQRFTS